MILSNKPVARLMAGACLALLCAACTTTQGVPALPPISEADLKVAEAVEISSRANRAIAEVEVAVAAPKRAGPNQTVPPGVTLPAELTEEITIDWQGKVEPLVAAIAGKMGYRFAVTGRPPAVPVVVSMSAKNEAVHDIIRRAGNMIHDHGDIALNPATRTIELRYGG